MRSSLNNISTKRLGRPKAAALYYVEVLTQMTYYIRTSFGVSKQYVQNSPGFNLRGLGKFNGAGHISCHTHMEPLLVSYSQAFNGFKLINPSHSIHSHRHILVHVNGKILILAIPEDKTTTEVLY